MHRPPSLPTSLLQLLSLINTQVLQVRSDATPTAIRKMSLDEGEKLLPEYLAFGNHNLPLAANAAYLDSRDIPSVDRSAAFQPPWGKHLMPRSNGAMGAIDSRGIAAVAAQRDVLARLQGRQFACPQNTNACTDIGKSDYCCATGTTCFVVKDAPDAGNVGCCPNGQNCIGSVGQCTGGSTACAAEVGGGCCIPGFVCANVGCKWHSNFLLGSHERRD